MRDGQIIGVFKLRFSPELLCPSGGHDRSELVSSDSGTTGTVERELTLARSADAKDFCGRK